MGASVTLITPQTFEQARQNGKVGKKWTGQGISIKNASGGAMEITFVDRRKEHGSTIHSWTRQKKQPRKLSE
jgi:hypothetical protein